MGAPIEDSVSGYAISQGNLDRWILLSCPADQAIINSATLATSTYMQFPMVASKSYLIRGIVFIDTTATGDAKYAFTAPGSPTLTRGMRWTCVPGGTPAFAAIDTATLGSTALLSATTSGAFVGFEILFQNATTVATFGFQFAQNTATNDTGCIIRAGSYLEYALA